MAIRPAEKVEKGSLSQQHWGWTLALAAEVGSAQGVTERLMSDETIRRALQRLQTNGKRAQHWLTRPEPQDARKKSGVIA